MAVRSLASTLVATASYMLVFMLLFYCMNFVIVHEEAKRKGWQRTHWMWNANGGAWRLYGVWIKSKYFVGLSIRSSQRPEPPTA